MLFNSAAFLTLLAIVLGVYYFLGRRSQNGLLLVASYVFYGWWDWRFCSLLLFSSVLDYVAAGQIKKARSQKRKKDWLLLSLVGNLGVLGFFKYFDFFSQSLQELLNLYGVRADWPTLYIILPIGISFYTFQSMAYTIDVYRGKLRPIQNFWNFALYVSFFPQLVAGPIERAGHLLPQLNRKREVDFNRICEGFLLMLIGFVRKIAIADYLAPKVDEVFAQYEILAGGMLVSGLLMFSLQIYADFAGYSDIARGTAKVFGIDLRVNFDQPYFSKSFSEFWKRWHISLSSWLRDYLYIPLGGNRKGLGATGRNLMITMLLGGLWHGASWTFVVWGGLHGIYLALERAYFKKGFGIPFVFFMATVTWVFFRSETLSGAVVYLLQMVSISSWSWGVFVAPLCAVGVLLCLDVPQFRAKNHLVFASWHWFPRGLFVAFCLALLMTQYRGEEMAPFIYFQF